MLVSHIGWDELLKTRSSVFVMEEEYRMQKATVETAPSSAALAPEGPVIHEDGTVEYPAGGATTNGNGKLGADENASTRAIVGQSIDPAHTPADQKPVAIGDEFDDTTSDTEGGESVEVEGFPGTDEKSEGTSEVVNGEAGADEAASTNGLAPTLDDAATLNSVERPSLVAMKEEGGDDDAKSALQQDYSFSNKRLCERWLDNLFMVLYEVSTLSSHPSYCVTSN